MLQALKLDSNSRPMASPGRATGSDLQRQAFAGYLSAATHSAARGLQMAAPCPVAHLETEPRTPSPRTEPTPERPASRSTEARTARAKPDEDVEDRPQEALEKDSEQAEIRTSQQVQKPEQPPPARENPRHEEDQEKPPADSGQTEALATKPAAQAPDPVAAAAPPPAAAVPTEPAPSASTPIGKTGQAGEAPPEAAVGQAPSIPGSLPGTTEAMDPLQIVASKAQQDLEQAAGGSHLHTQIVEEAPNAASKPALSELLSVPKPAMETPKPVLSTGKASEGTGKELPASPFLGSDNTTDKPIPQLATLATPAPLVAESLQSTLPRIETSTEKPSAFSNPSIAAGGPGTMVKGTTPVPALESAQGAKANATFEQVDGSIRWILKNQQQGAEIQLNPESLGRVVIQLRMEGGEVHAKVWASEASTVPILQDQKAALAASLQQQGLSLGSFDLQQGRGGGDAHFQTPAQASGSGAGIALSQEKKQDLPMVAPALPGGAHLIEVLA